MSDESLVPEQCLTGRRHADDNVVLVAEPPDEYLEARPEAWRIGCSRYALQPS